MHQALLFTDGRYHRYRLTPGIRHLQNHVFADPSSPRYQPAVERALVNIDDLLSFFHEVSELERNQFLFLNEVLLFLLFSAV